MTSKKPKGLTTRNLALKIAQRVKLEDAREFKTEEKAEVTSPLSAVATTPDSNTQTIYVPHVQNRNQLPVRMFPMDNDATMAIRLLGEGVAKNKFGRFSVDYNEMDIRLKKEKRTLSAPELHCFELYIRSNYIEISGMYAAKNIKWLFNHNFSLTSQSLATIESKDSEQKQDKLLKVNGQVIDSIMQVGGVYKVLLNGPQENHVISTILDVFMFWSSLQLSIQAQILAIHNKLKVGTLDISRSNNELVKFTSDGIVKSEDWLNDSPVLASLWMHNNLYMHAQSIRKYLGVSISVGNISGQIKEGDFTLDDSRMSDLERKVFNDLQILYSGIRSGQSFQSGKFIFEQSLVWDVPSKVHQNSIDSALGIKGAINGEQTVSWGAKVGEFQKEITHYKSLGDIGYFISRGCYLVRL